MTRIGQRIRSLRAQRGERLEDVAQAVHRSVSSISRLENGSRLPSDSLLTLLAMHFGVPREGLSELVRQDVQERASVSFERRYPEAPSADWLSQLEGGRGLSARTVPPEQRPEPDYGSSLQAAQHAIRRAIEDLRLVGQESSTGLRLRQPTGLANLADPLVRELRRVAEQAQDPDVRATSWELLSKLGSGL